MPNHLLCQSKKERKKGREGRANDVMMFKVWLPNTGSWRPMAHPHALWLWVRGMHHHFIDSGNWSCGERQSLLLLTLLWDKNAGSSLSLTITCGSYNKQESTPNTMISEGAWTKTHQIYNTDTKETHKLKKVNTPLTQKEKLLKLQQNGVCSLGEVGNVNTLECLYDH